MRLSILLSILPLALAAPAKRSSPAPLIAPTGDAQIIPNQYIVKFKDGSSLAALDNTLSAMVGDATHVYSSVMQGFAGPLDAARLETLRNHPDVSCLLKNCCT